MQDTADLNKRDLEGVTVGIRGSGLFSNSMAAEPELPRRAHGGFHNAGSGTAVYDQRRGCPAEMREIKSRTLTQKALSDLWREPFSVFFGGKIRENKGVNGTKLYVMHEKMQIF